MSAFSIKPVDHLAKAVRHDIEAMHEVCFPDLPMIELLDGHFWWLAYDDDGDAIGFCALWPSVRMAGGGYLARAGVMPEARGNGLQMRMIRVRERKARTMDWTVMVSDTNRDNPASANNMIRAGYRIFWPPQRWSNDASIYWRKFLTEGVA